MTRGFEVIYTHERVTRFDVMNIHCGTFVGGLRASEKEKRRGAFRTWLKLATGPGIWAYLLLEKTHNRPAPGRYWIADSEMIKREVQQVLSHSRRTIFHRQLGRGRAGLQRG